MGAIGFGQTIGCPFGAARPRFGDHSVERIGALAQSNAAAIGKLGQTLLDDTAMLARIRDHRAARGHQAVMGQADAERNRHHVARLESVES